MSDLFSQNDFSDQELEQLTAINPIDVRVAAMNFLARREHTLHELRKKLKRRFPDEQLIDEQLQQLVDENLQSDKRFAESFVRQRAARGKGPLRLRQEMRERGIPAADYELTMEEADIDWCQVAAEVMLKKFGEAKEIDIKEKARRSRFMQYRGFNVEHFKHLLD